MMSDAGEIVIGFASRRIDVDSAPLLSALSDPQRQRAQAMPPRRQRQFGLGRWVLQELARNYAERIQINEREGLAPLLMIDQQPLYCSISHCRVPADSVRADVAVDIAVAVIHNADIGVDIEVIRPDWSAEKAALFCTHAERQAATALTDQAQRDRFYTQCWSRKEALSKFYQRSIWHAKTIATNVLLENKLHSLELPQRAEAASVVGAICVEAPAPIRLCDLTAKLA